MGQVRILIADTHEIVRLGVRSILNSNNGWEVCGEAANGQELITHVQRLHPDLVIMEIAMTSLEGLNAVREVFRRVPGQKILALTHCDSELLAQQALEAGVRGLLLKSDAAAELRTAVEAIIKGVLYFTSRVSEMLLKGFSRVSVPKSQDVRCCSILTAREKEILKAIALGLSNRRISEVLGLSIKTVHSHRDNIMRKLDLHSMAEVALFAVRNNMLPTDKDGISAHDRVPTPANRNISNYPKDGRCPRQ